MEKSKNPLVCKALSFAEMAHAGVPRKFTGEPYVEHPKRVAARLAALGFRPEVVAAGLLHDVVEDTHIVAAVIAAEFGPDVAALVAEVTKPVVVGIRAVRKAAFRAQLAKASYEGASIKLADEGDNSRDVAELSPEFAALCMPEMRDDLAVLGHGHPVLVAELAANLANYFRMSS